MPRSVLLAIVRVSTMAEEATTVAATRPSNVLSAEPLHRKIREIYTKGFALGEDDKPHDSGWSLAPGRG